MSTSDRTATPALLGTTELVDSIAAAADVHRPLVRALLGVLEDIVTDALVAGRSVRLPGIGTLTPRQTAARTGTSPARHGHPARDWTRPAGRRVHYRPTRELLARMQPASGSTDAP